MKKRQESAERLAYEAHKTAREQVLETLTEKLQLGLDAIGAIPSLEEIQQAVATKVDVKHNAVELNQEQVQNLTALDGQLKYTVGLLENRFMQLTSQARDEAALQERLAHQVEQDRLAQVEQDRLAQVEQERLAQVEQERLAKLEQERLAQAQPRVEPVVDPLVQQRAEQERLAKAEQERLARVEHERFARVEHERLVRVQQERLAQAQQPKPPVDPLSRRTQEELGREAQARKTGTTYPQVEIEESEEQLQQAYTAARTRLDQFSCTPKLKAKIEDMLAQVDKLYNAGNSCKDLTTAMDATWTLLKSDEEQEDLDAFNAVANKMQGHASLGWKILGILMMAVGAAVAAFGVATGVTGVDLGLTSAGGASLFAAGSLTFYKGTQGGLSKAMSNVGAAVTVEEDEDSGLSLAR